MVLFAMLFDGHSVYSVVTCYKVYFDTSTYFVAITGPPEIKEIIKKVYQLSFFTNFAFINNVNICVLFIP